MRTFMTLLSVTAATILASIATPAAAAVNISIDSIVYNMNQPSEALVINPVFDWQKNLP